MHFTSRLALMLVCLALYPSGSRADAVKFDVRTARSGAWSDAATWKHAHLPTAGDSVQIRPGHSIVYDVNSDKALRIVHVGGTLTFSRAKDTRLDVGLLLIQPGDAPTLDGADCSAHGGDHAEPAQTNALPAALEIGTFDKPIPAGITATIRLVYFPGANKETEPAIINCGGRWDVHGAPMSQTWLKLARPAKAGDNSITASETVAGWKPGDHIIITSSQHLGYIARSKHSSDNNAYDTEDRVIAKINGATIQLNQPLVNPHEADEDGHAEVANLSRNVVIESADPSGVRGHTMFHRNSTGSISYAEFRHLGKEGILGRYPIHFHLVRDSMRGSSVIGASIWDSKNRWIAIHGTDYLLVRDCVGYQCLGHGYFLEDATEQYNILDHNLAIQAFGAKKLPHQALGFDNNEGAGFWWANGRNTLTRNCACENNQYGFRFQIEGSKRGREAFKSLRTPDGGSQETDVRTVPFFRFEDNESHSNGLYDFDFGDDPDGSVHGDATHPFIVRNLKSWKTNYALRPNVSYFVAENLSFYDEVYGVYHPNYDQQVFRSVLVKHVASEPINRGHDDDSYQNGSFTYDGLTIENCRCGRDPLIQLSCTSDKPDQSGHFRNVKIINSQSPTNVVDLGGGPRNDNLENGVIYYFHDWPVMGQTLKVASVKFPALMKDGKYESIPHLTGPDVRAAQMPEMPFPDLLHPIDDLPPATIITSVHREGGSLYIRGISEDNGEVASVNVNGKPAEITSNHAGVADWEATIDASGVKQVIAAGTDRAGNVERLPAQFVISPG